MKLFKMLLCLLGFFFFVTLATSCDDTNQPVKPDDQQQEPENKPENQKPENNEPEKKPGNDDVQWLPWL